MAPRGKKKKLEKKSKLNLEKIPAARERNACCDKYLNFPEREPPAVIKYLNFRSFASRAYA